MGINVIFCATLWRPVIYSAMVVLGMFGFHLGSRGGGGSKGDIHMAMMRWAERAAKPRIRSFGLGV